MKGIHLLLLFLSFGCNQTIKKEKICDVKSKGFALASLFFAQKNEPYCYFANLASVTLAYARNSNLFLDKIPITNQVPIITGPITTIRVNPALPNGLVLNSSTGVISGTPTEGSPETNYTFTVTGSNTIIANFVMKIRVGTTTAIRVYGQSGDFSCGVINRNSTSYTSLLQN